MCLRFAFLLTAQVACTASELGMEAVTCGRGSNFTAAFDAILADAGIRTVLCNVRTPRMNAIAERWIGGCRRELLNEPSSGTRPIGAHVSLTSAWRH
jgi:transposase InsO family protein